MSRRYKKDVRKLLAKAALKGHSMFGRRVEDAHAAQGPNFWVDKHYIDGKMKDRVPTKVTPKARARKAKPDTSDDFKSPFGPKTLRELVSSSGGPQRYQDELAQQEGDVPVRNGPISNMFRTSPMSPHTPNFGGGSTFPPGSVKPYSPEEAAQFPGRNAPVSSRFNTGMQGPHGPNFESGSFPSQTSYSPYNPPERLSTGPLTTPEGPDTLRQTVKYAGGPQRYQDALSRQEQYNPQGMSPQQDPNAGPNTGDFPSGVAQLSSMSGTPDPQSGMPTIQQAAQSMDKLDNISPPITARGIPPIQRQGQGLPPRTGNPWYDMAPYYPKPTSPGSNIQYSQQSMSDVPGRLSPMMPPEGPETRDLPPYPRSPSALDLLPHTPGSSSRGQSSDVMGSMDQMMPPEAAEHGVSPLKKYPAQENDYDTPQSYQESTYYDGYHEDPYFKYRPYEKPKDVALTPQQRSAAIDNINHELHLPPIGDHRKSRLVELYPHLFEHGKRGDESVLQYPRISNWKDSDVHEVNFEMKRHRDRLVTSIKKILNGPYMSKDWKMQAEEKFPDIFSYSDATDTLTWDTSAETLPIRRLENLYNYFRHTYPMLPALESGGLKTPLDSRIHEVPRRSPTPSPTPGASISPTVRESVITASPSPTLTEENDDVSPEDYPWTPYPSPESIRTSTPTRSATPSRSISPTLVHTASPTSTPATTAAHSRTAGKWPLYNQEYPAYEDGEPQEYRSDGTPNDAWKWSAAQNKFVRKEDWVPSGQSTPTPTSTYRPTASPTQSPTPSPTPTSEASPTPGASITPAITQSLAPQSAEADFPPERPQATPEVINRGMPTRPPARSTSMAPSRTPTNAPTPLPPRPPVRPAPRPVNTPQATPEVQEVKNTLDAVAQDAPEIQPVADFVEEHGDAIREGLPRAMGGVVLLAAIGGLIGRALFGGGGAPQQDAGIDHGDGTDTPGPTPPPAPPVTPTPTPVPPPRPAPAPQPRVRLRPGGAPNGARPRWW